MSLCIILLVFLSVLPFRSIAFSSPDSTGIKNIKGKWYILHRVEKGEGQFGIARRYQVSVNDLRAANPGLTTTLKIGQVLQVPVRDSLVSENTLSSDTVSLKLKEVTSPDTVSTRTPLHHKVKSGESLYGIAKKYGVTRVELRNWNRLKTDALIAGKWLIVGYSAAGRPDTLTAELPAEPVITEPPAVLSPPVRDTLLQEPKDITAGHTPPPVIKEIIESGIASRAGDHEIDPKRYYAFHNKAPVGTIIRVTSRQDGKIVFVKVIGVVPEGSDRHVLLIVLSRRALDKLGVTDQRLLVELSYGVVVP